MTRIHSFGDGAPRPQSPAAACFHCALPVAAPGRHRACVLGEEREFCCAGCEAVARTIVLGGFERYYETRESHDTGVGRAPLPGDLPPSEVYDDAEAQRQFVATPSEYTREATLILDRIRCAACLWLNEQWLRRQPGVLRADINYATQRAQIAWDLRRAKLSAIIEAVRAIGYDAYPYDPRREDQLARRENRRALWRLFVAGFGAMQVMMYAVPAYVDAGSGTLTRDVEQLMRWASLVLTLPVVLFSSQPFFAGAWQDLRARRIGLDVPIALGVAIGFAASAWATLAAQGEVYFDTVSSLVFLLLGARYMESVARRRASRKLDPLARWMPSFALRLADASDDASAVRVTAHVLKAGDRVLVPPGDRIPADGEVERGASSADESLLTGEARPVAKTAGAALVGGSVNLEQPLVMRVTRAAADTQAAAIARLVERAAAGRPRLVERADRIARSLTVVVLAAAAAAFLYWWQVEPARALWITVAVFVVTCPCALALAAPIVLTRANGMLLARGAALTRTRAIEALERTTDIVLDKTGTLTTGRYALVRMETLGTATRDDCLALARSLEAASRHPIARALAREQSTQRVRQADELRNFPGHGVEGRVGDRRLRIGSARFCGELCGSDLPGEFAACVAQQTTVYLADDAGWIAALAFEDRLRDDAQATVEAFKARGLAVHLLSGDAQAVVQALAQRLQIGHSAAGATPQEKFAYVERLQRAGRVVAMAGDGLNDAPVLAAADVSFAMAGGADAAQMQADVVLLGEGRLLAIDQSFALARGAMQVIRQNFAWALAYNVVALPLAASGWIGPWEAALGMAASSFVVVLNAMRPLLRETPALASVATPGLARSEAGR
ncbi:MAG: heavy metal translocating P-type ATPase [Betaproteobacteria bacterium]|nr:heavy metal translocating P-type ATPase [Betaproteobacteria bacterium]